MEMKTSVVKPTPTGADNGINRIALAVLIAVGALSAMGVGLTIFLATIYDGKRCSGMRISGACHFGPQRLQSSRRTGDDNKPNQCADHLIPLLLSWPCMATLR